MPDIRPDQIAEAWKLPFEGAWPTAVAFLGSHRRVAAANQEGAILVWDLPEQPERGKLQDDQGKEIDGIVAPPPKFKLVGHENGVTHLLASPDGALLISTSLDKTVRIWDLARPPAGKTQTIVDSQRRQRAAKRVEASKRDAILQAPGVEVDTLEAAAVLTGHVDWIQAAGLSGDGKRLITGDDSALTIVWDLAARRETARWRCPGVAWAVSAALDADGRTALVSQYRRKGGDFNNYPAGLRLFDAADGALRLDLLAALYPKEKNPPYQYQYEYHKFVAAGLVATAFSPDGALFACGQGGEEGDGKVHLLETATGKLVRTIGGHQYGVTDLEFSRDGRLLFTTGRDTTLRILQVADGQELAKLGKPRGGQFTDWLSALAISPDERWLAASDISGHVQLWRL